ncbi:MAG TPA: DUF5362 family protein [Luteolibacter sp.]
MDNPYTTGTPSHQAPAHPSHGLVDPLAVQALQGTKPWVRLCSVIGFISTGFMLLAAVAMLFGGAFMATQKQTFPFAGFQFLLGLLYAVMGVFYIFPSMKLWKYGSAILRLMTTGSNADLVEALDQQRSFWKFVGVMILVMIALYVVAIIGAVGFTFMTAARGIH